MMKYRDAQSMSGQVLLYLGTNTDRLMYLQVVFNANLINDIKKQGSKVKKVCKQVTDQRNGVQVLLENKM